MHSTGYVGSADGDLVDAARRGERDAFGELVLRHQQMALRVAIKRVGSSELARDVVQEASLVAMTNLDRLRSPERFGSWFCGIALNVARRWSAEARALTPVSDQLADPATGPEERVLAAETAQAIRDAVNSLADGQRAAVSSVYLRGLSYREAASAMNISVTAVKSRLHQARKNLAPQLTDHDVRTESAVETQTMEEWIAVDVSDVRRGPGSEGIALRHAVVLSDRDRTIAMPIWVGPFEATSIALHLTGTETPRPLTYQFAAGLLAAAGSHVEQVRITALSEGVLYAIVAVEATSGKGEVDCRPSDALNLALECDAPILLSRTLVDDSNISIDTEWRDYPETAHDIAAEAAQRMGGNP